jgi:hypothetical protein
VGHPRGRCKWCGRSTHRWRKTCRSCRDTPVRDEVADEVAGSVVQGVVEGFFRAVVRVVRGILRVLFD